MPGSGKSLRKKEAYPADAEVSADMAVASRVDEMRGTRVALKPLLLEGPTPQMMLQEIPARLGSVHWGGNVNYEFRQAWVKRVGSEAIARGQNLVHQTSLSTPELSMYLAEKASAAGYKIRYELILATPEILEANQERRKKDIWNWLTSASPHTAATPISTFFRADPARFVPYNTTCVESIRTLHEKYPGELILLFNNGGEKSSFLQRYSERFVGAPPSSFTGQGYIQFEPMHRAVLQHLKKHAPATVA
jgi:hypothetical protein